MKKILLVGLLLLQVFLFVACNRSYDIPEREGDKMNLFYEGKSNYAIVYGKDAIKAEKTAAKELQKYLKEITGFKLKLYDDSKKEEKYEILVGETNRGDYLNYEELGTEGFEIKWEGTKLIIGGGKTRGTLYGVYDFLESLGCRFLAIDTEVIPKLKTISLDRQSIVKTPAFEYRDVYWASTFDEVLSSKLKLNGAAGKKPGDTGYYRRIGEDYGNAIEYAGDFFVHTFNMLVPLDEYFSSHPEYYSLIDGKRNGTYLYTQLCLTNEDVLNIVIEKVKVWLRDNPNAKIVSVSQDDSYVITSYCTCEECKKVNKEARSESGTLIHFVNKVADAIKDEFPDVAVDTLAYQYSITPPKKIDIRDNVIIRYCTGSCSSHVIGKDPCLSGVANNIRIWAKESKRIYIWDYTTNFAQYLCPFPNLHTLQANMQFFAENNVKGVFSQGQYQDDSLPGEFAELRAYVLAKLHWDPYVNIEEVIDDFLEGYYKEAKEPVKAYLDFIHNKIIESNRCFNLVVDAKALFAGLIDQEDIDYLDSLWEEAKEKTSGKYQDHVKRSELAHRWYKISAGYGSETLDDLYKDGRKLGVTRLSEGANIPNVNP